MKMVVQQMQVLDQQVTAVAVCGRFTDQGPHLFKGLTSGLPTFEL
jgi:hypothetical protein